jgi:hypothetical protein
VFQTILSLPAVDMSIAVQLHALSYVLATDRVVFLAENKEEIQDRIRTLIFGPSFHVS